MTALREQKLNAYLALFIYFGIPIMATPVQQGELNHILGKNTPWLTNLNQDLRQTCKERLELNRKFKAYVLITKSDATTFHAQVNY
jgi:hypothetical protein